MKDKSRKDGEGPHNEGEQDDKKKKENEWKKDVSQASPRLDHIAQLFKRNPNV